MQHYKTQILILGGGPAGGAAALELAQAGCDVALLERQQTLGWKIGETLPPETRVHLQRLNHWQTFQRSGHLPCHGIVSCWGSPIPVQKDFIMNPYGHGWQLDRAKFEGALLNSAENAGAQLFFGAEAESARFESDHWRVETTIGQFEANWLLDCTGPSGLLASLGFGGEFERLQAFDSLACILKAPSDTDRDGRTYVESHPDGWAYSALMPNGSRIVVFLTDPELIPADADSAEWMQQRIQAGSQIKRLLAAHDYPPITAVHRAQRASGRYQTLAGPRWILVGDAGMTFDPLSGWGATKALVSAGAAVQTVLNGSDYQASCDKLWAHYVRQYRDYYLAERRWPNAPFWSRRHQTVWAR